MPRRPVTICGACRLLKYMRCSRANLLSCAQRRQNIFTSIRVDVVTIDGPSEHFQCGQPHREARTKASAAIVAVVEGNYSVDGIACLYLGSCAAFNSAVASSTENHRLREAISR
jgi:hypothetical protein